MVAFSFSSCPVRSAVWCGAGRDGERMAGRRDGGGGPKRIEKGRNPLGRCKAEE